METIEVQVDDNTKAELDSLFSGLGLDTPTAVKIFFAKSLEYDGIPFAVNHRALSLEMLEAVEDTRLRRNLIGPFKTAEEAVAAMLEE